MRRAHRGHRRSLGFGAGHIIGWDTETACGFSARRRGQCADSVVSLPTARLVTEAPRSPRGGTYE
jgi:hypothetical protein